MLGTFCTECDREIIAPPPLPPEELFSVEDCMEIVIDTEYFDNITTIWTDYADRCLFVPDTTSSSTASSSIADETTYSKVLVKNATTSVFQWTSTETSIDKGIDGIILQVTCILLFLIIVFVGVFMYRRRKCDKNCGSKHSEPFITQMKMIFRYRNRIFQIQQSDNDKIGTEQSEEMCMSIQIVAENETDRIHRVHLHDNNSYCSSNKLEDEICLSADQHKSVDNKNDSSHMTIRQLEDKTESVIQDVECFKEISSSRSTEVLIDPVTLDEQQSKKRGFQNPSFVDD